VFWGTERSWVVAAQIADSGAARRYGPYDSPAAAARSPSPGELL